MQVRHLALDLARVGSPLICLGQSDSFLLIMLTYSEHEHFCSSSFREMLINLFHFLAWMPCIRDFFPFV